MILEKNITLNVLKISIIMISGKEGRHVFLHNFLVILLQLNLHIFQRGNRKSLKSLFGVIAIVRLPFFPENLLLFFG